MADILMPKATAVWLIDNTTLTFEQVAEFCGLHKLEVKGIADGDVASGIMGVNPVQNGQLTREEIEKAEAAVDWSRPAAEVDRQIRGLSPFPGAWTLIGGERVKLLGSKLAQGAGEAGVALDDALTIACGDGAVALTRLQKAGKAAQDADVFLRGFAVPKGTQLGEG